MEDSWQLSQPLHLRHLAVLRDVASVTRVPYYVHFTFPNYKRKVEDGDAVWEAVESIKSGKANSHQDRNTMANLDKFGFPILDMSKFAGKKRSSTLAQCVETERREPFRLKGQDPMVVTLSNGKLGKATVLNVISLTNGMLDVSWSCNPFVTMKKMKALIPKSEMTVLVDGNDEPIPCVERRGGLRIPKPRSDLHYFPSRFAHTRLVIGICTSREKLVSVVPRLLPSSRTFVSLSGVSGWHDKKKLGRPKTRGRPPKVAKKPKRKSKPSNPIETTGNTADSSNTNELAAQFNRKRTAETAELGEQLTQSKRPRQELRSNLGYLPSRHAHTTPIFPALLKANPLGAKQLKPMPTRKLPTRIPRVKPQKPKEPEVMSYEEQSRTLERRESGCYVGDMAKLRRVGSRGRNPNSRLAIFRSSRLGELDWFLQKPSSTKEGTPKLSQPRKRKLPWLNEQHQTQPSDIQPQEVLYPTAPAAPIRHMAQAVGSRDQRPELAVQSLPSLPFESPGTSLPVWNDAYVSPYTPAYAAFQSSPYAPTAAPAIHPLSYGPTAVPLSHPSPYAPTSLPPTSQLPFALTTALHGTSSGLLQSPVSVQPSSHLPTALSFDRHASQAISSAMMTKTTLKRSCSRNYQGYSALRVGEKHETVATPLPKRRKVEDVVELVTAEKLVRSRSSLRLVFKGLDPRRFRLAIQASEAPIIPGSALNLEDGVMLIGSNSLGEAPPILPLERGKGILDALGNRNFDNADVSCARQEVGKSDLSPRNDSDIRQYQGYSSGTIDQATESRLPMISKNKGPPKALSSPKTRLIDVSKSKSADTQSTEDSLGSLGSPVDIEMREPGNDVTSVSSEQSFATARSRNNQSGSPVGSPDPRGAETSGKPNAERVDGSVGFPKISEHGRDALQLCQAIPSKFPSTIVALKAGSKIRTDANGGNVPIFQSQMGSGLNEADREENETVNDRPKPENHLVASESAHSSTAPVGAKNGITDSKSATPELKRGQDGGAEAMSFQEKFNNAQQEAIDSDLSEPEIIHTIENIPPTLERRTRRAPKPFSNQQVIQSGGSTGVLRRKIIMEILDEAGGLYPSGTELWYPFRAAWLTKGIASKPDNRTIRYAVKALVDSGKVRQLTFTFQNKKGFMAEKKIITRVDISPSDPKVVELKRNMVEKHPQCFFPPKPELSSALKRDLDSQGLLDKLAAKETLPTMQELEREKAKNKAMKEQMDKEKKERKAVWQHGAGQRRKTYVKEYNAGKRLEKLKSNPNHGVYQHPGDLWETMPSGSWSPWNYGHSTRNYNYADHEAELARLRKAMSDADRYRMLDSMSPYNSIWKGSGDWNMPHRLAALRIPEIQSQSQDEGTAGVRDKQPNGVRPVAKDTVACGKEQTPIPALQDQKQKKKSIEVMPKNLEEMLSQYSPPSLPPLSKDMPDHKKFNDIVDRVVYWELDTELAQTIDRNALYFINHQFDGVHDEVEYPKSASYPFLNAYQGQEDVMSALARLKLPQHMRARYRPPQLPKPYQPPTADAKGDDAPKENESPKQKRRRRERPQLTNDSKAVHRLALLKEQVSKLKPIETEPNTGRSYTNLRLRGPASLRYLPASEERRIMLAVIIVRTLAGGLEKNIDWRLIAYIFKDKYTEIFIHRKWTYMMQKYRSHINKMQDNFQVLFAKAYEDDLVPPVNFNSLEEYNWDEVIQWTDKHLDSQFSSAQLVTDSVDLPFQRSNIDDLFDLQAPAAYDQNSEYFELQGPITIPRRFVVAHAEPAVIAFAAHGSKQALDKRSLPMSSGMDDVAIAKSWVKANIITPVSTYSSDFASSKFSLLPESAIQHGLKGLFNSKQITQETKTAYELAGVYITRLHRNIGVSMLKDAVAYKMRLDEAFEHGKKLLVQQTASDGECLAMVDLAVRRMVNMKATDPPMNEWGLLEKGQYETRRMNKKQKLFFEVRTDCTEKYKTGCPLPLPLPEPPLRSEQRMVENVKCIPVSSLETAPLDTADIHITEFLKNSRGQSAPGPTALKAIYSKATRKDPIPMWYDINGAVVTELWQTCIAAVLSTVVLRPGIPLQTLCLGLKDTLERFEIEGVVQWLVDARAARWCTSCATEQEECVGEAGSVEVTEGWWGVLWDSVKEKRGTGNQNGIAKAASMRNVEFEFADVEMGGI